MKVTGYAVTLLILAFWVTMNSMVFLRQRELRTQDRYRAGVTQYLGNELLRERWLGVYRKNKKVGYTGQVFEKVFADEGIEIHGTIESAMEIEFLGKPISVNLDGKFVLDAELKPKSLRLDLRIDAAPSTLRQAGERATRERPVADSLQGQPEAGGRTQPPGLEGDRLAAGEGAQAAAGGSAQLAAGESAQPTPREAPQLAVREGAQLTLTGQPRGDKFVLVLRRGPVAILTLPFPREELLVGDGLVPSLPVSGLKVGDTFRVPCFDPLTMSRSVAEVQVTLHDTREVDGLLTDIFRLESRFRDLTSTSWVTTTGELLRQEFGAPLKDIVLRKETRANARRFFRR